MSRAQEDPSTTPALRADAVGRRFGRVWALRDVAFELPAGHTLLVVGGNGSGKSTLLRLILGLDRPDNGTLEVFGDGPRGVLLHDDAVYPQLTVAETIDLWRGVCGSRWSTDELIESVDLAPAADRRVGQLSAGMRKRLALTRTLMVEPELVVWDEPLSSLDAAGRSLALDLVRRFKRESVSVVVASHEREVFASLADQVLNLDTHSGPARLPEPTS